MRQREVIQAGDVQQRHIEIKRRLAVGSVEGAVLGGMLIDAESDVEGVLNVCRRAFDIDDHAIGGGVDHGQAIGLRETKHGGVVGFSGTKSAGELLDAEILVEAGTLRIVDLLQQIVEFGFIPRRQRDGQAQTLCAGKVADQGRDSAGDCLRDMGGQGGALFGLGRGCGEEKDGARTRSAARHCEVGIADSLFI